MNRPILVVGAPLLLVIALGATAQHGSTPHWTYDGKEGPPHWSSLDSAFKTCGVGTHQSPIDVRGAVAADLPAIGFHYKPSRLEIVDNGHTIQVTYAPGSSVTIGNETYQLKQFHFHHPAEERVSGKLYPLVAHLVHSNADGHVAVIAVLFTTGRPNESIANVWRHLPAQGNEVSADSITIDATGLLPKSHGYFTFTGSLTTPPCTEGVTWFVLKTHVQASKEQIATFAERYPHNARPLQPLHGRSIKMTK